MRKTGYVHDERLMWHDTGTYTGWVPSGINSSIGRFNQPWKHDEGHEAKRRCHNLISASGVIDCLHPIRAQDATEEHILLCHTQPYLESVKRCSASGGGAFGDCCVMGPGGYEIMLRSTGAAIAACDAVMKGDVDNAYALCRPPGHHAEAGQALGYCFFNNVAITAKYCMKQYGVKRVAIVDFDVHHGNGTQSIFYESPDVLFISIHQDRLYPTHGGGVEEIGTGAGAGYNINVPVPPGSGIGCYEAITSEIVVPALSRFNPEVILISAGYDACALDPLSHVMLPSSTYGYMVNSILKLNTKVIALHEGGYSEVYAPFCMLRVVEALMGIPKSVVTDEFDAEIRLFGQQDLQPHQRALIDGVKKIHNL